LNQKKRDGKKVEEENSKKRKLAEIEAESNPEKKAKTINELIAERQVDADERVFSGKVKFYKPKKKFGFIIPKKSIEYKGQHWKRVFVREEDIVCFTPEIGLMKGAEVKFHIYKDSRGIGAHDIRNMDDTPIEYEPVKKKTDNETAKQES